MKGLQRKFDVYYHYLIEKKLLWDFAEWLKHYESDLKNTQKSLNKLQKKK